ncbi:MAG: O-antigen ligase family protein, partial [Acidobacteriota bacterium]
LAAAPLPVAALAWGGLRTLPEPWRRRLPALIVGAGAAQALLTLAFRDPDWMPAGYRLLSLEPGRFTWIGTLGNPGYVATFLVLPALLAAERAVRSPKRRWAWGAASGVMTAVAVGTATLSAVAALLAGGAVLAFRAVPARRRWAALGATVAFGAALVAATPLRTRVTDAVRQTRVGGWQWMGSARGAAASAALSMIAARPFAGVGPGRFAADSFRFQDEATLASRGQVLGLETGFGEAHNDPLQFAAETGALGVALAVFGVILALRRGARPDRDLPATPALLAAAAVLALTHFPLHVAAIAAQWLVLAALAVPPLAAGRRTPVGWPAAAAVLVVAGAAAAIGWQRSSASADIAGGRRLSESLRASSAANRATRAGEALDRLGSRARWLPGSWDARVILGNLAVDAGRPDAAVRHFQAALALAERPEIRFNVGVALLRTGDRAAGLTHLQRAVELNPAILRAVTDAGLARALRARLDASGYAARHPWIYQGTLLASP